MTQEQDWARASTKRIAAEIRSRRGKRSVQWLSDRTAACGYRVSRSRIADLEGGTRGGVLGLAELLVLAAALQMPPALLLYPVHTGEKVAPLPNLNTDPWHAYKALTGEIVLVPAEPLPDGTELAGPNIAVQRTEPVVAAYRRHEHAATEYYRRREFDPDTAEPWLTALTIVRREMAAQGWALPPLDLDAALALEKASGSAGSDQ